MRKDWMSVQYSLILLMGRSVMDITGFCYYFESKSQLLQETCGLPYMACRPLLTENPGSKAVKDCS